MSRTHRLLPRLRVAAMTVFLTVTGLGLQAAPVPAPATGGDQPFSLPLPFGLGPQQALAAYCATGPSFTGKLTQQLVNSGTPSTAARITSSTVYGWISNVDSTWSCTLYRRYSGIVWNTTSSLGLFDYGTIINSTSVGCNWGVGSTDYLKANGTSTCPTSDTSNVLSIGLTKERVYRADASHNGEGDYSFVHSDCDTTPYYGTEVVKGSEASGVSFSTGTTNNRPGANCDPIDLDSTGTSQTVTYDKTAPTLAVTQPGSGTPTAPQIVPSAFFTVQFDATDAVAGFGGSSVWSLQRQIATWSGSTCGTFASDTAPGNLVTGTTSATGQLSGQSLAVGPCYRWALSGTDQNGNAAAVQTSGIIRTDTSAVLGAQPQLRTESWDLGAGDALAVSVGSGNVTLTHPVVTLPIRGSSVSIFFGYNSQDTTNVGFGPGWRLNVQRRLAVNADGTVTFTDGTGARFTFTNPTVNGTTTAYTRPAALYANLVKTGSGSFTLTYRDQSTDAFTLTGSEGLLTRQQDRFGNGVTLSYVTGTNRITAITDTAANPNRTIDFAYDGSGRLTSITDWAYLDNFGVVQATATGSRRATRFFYDASSRLLGWAEPLNTGAACPSNPLTTAVASHLTCLAYSGGMVTSVVKNLTHIQPTDSNGDPVQPMISLPYATANIRTTVAYSQLDATSVTDADGGATVFSHPGVGQTQVVRPGTPASTTLYTLASPTDAYGRVTSVKRKLGAAWIEERTAYDSAYPVEPDSVTQDYVDGTPSNAVPDQDVVTGYAYVASSLGLVSRLTEPLTASTHRTTDYTYNANNDVTTSTVSLDGSGTVRTVTVNCWGAYNAALPTDQRVCPAGTGLYLVRTVSAYAASPGPVNADANVAVDSAYDAYGERLLETRHDHDADGNPLADRVSGWTYDALGDTTSSIAGYGDGQVSPGGYDITPDPATGARTDLTTVYGYDTAGDRISTADPRRAVEAAKETTLAPTDFVATSGFDALRKQVSALAPTTPGLTGTAASQTWTYNELGGQIEHLDFGGAYTATTTDGRGLPIATWQDPDYTGILPMAQLSATTYDAAGRAITQQDAEQTADASLGHTTTTYDELGRATEVLEAAGSTPDVSSTTDTTYDAVGRATGSTTGDVSSSTTYDLGGRALSTDDGFTCATTNYDYRDLETQVVTGLTSGSCTGGSPTTTTLTADGLGRTMLRQVDAANQPESNTYDAVGNRLATSATQNGTTTGSTYTLNPLDQVITATATDGSTTKTNRDAAGNATDTCYWKPGATVGACMPADTANWANPPTQTSTVLSDARGQRVALTTRLGSSSTVATTTYDPTNNYQISRFYVPTHYTAAGLRDAEAQDLYSYDGRHRLSTITHQWCAVNPGTDTCAGTATPTGSDTYVYDGNDNRTSVTESAGGGTATTVNYCYDARNQLGSEKAAGSCTDPASSDAIYTYDEAGNRISAGAPTALPTPLHGARTFTYNAAGQLTGCTSPSCTVTPDADGRMKTITDTNGTWAFRYDADGKLISACKSSACLGSGFDRVDWLYDGDGHRTQVKETTAGGVVTTTDLRYARDAVVQESVNGNVTRTYAIDDGGRVIEVCDPDCAAGTVYLVTWNGHGDATGLWRKNADGTLTLANSYTYSGWGMPTTTVAPTFSDLHFRFLYVGAFDVQWDDSFGLHLLYMHARTYIPSLGRFLQPDPARADGNLYRYAANNPTTYSDPTGLAVNIRFTRHAAAVARAKRAISYSMYRKVYSKSLQPYARRLCQARALGYGGGHSGPDDCGWCPGVVMLAYASGCGFAFNLLGMICAPTIVGGPEATLACLAILATAGAAACTIGYNNTFTGDRSPEAICKQLGACVKTGGGF